MAPGGGIKSRSHTCFGAPSSAPGGRVMPSWLIKRIIMPFGASKV